MVETFSKVTSGSALYATILTLVSSRLRDPMVQKALAAARIFTSQEQVF